MAAGCWQAWKQTKADTQLLQYAIAAMDLPRSALLNNDLMVGLNLVNLLQTGRVIPPNSPEWRNAIQNICQQASESAPAGAG